MEEMGRDLLDALPLCLTQEILTRVPIRDAIRTSILSRRWRHIWATVPELVFDRECASVDAKNNFITLTLLLHQGTINKFKLYLSSNDNGQACNIDQWLVFLSRNGVQELILDFEGYLEWFEIHPNLYSCEKLTQLELANSDVPSPPQTFKGFLKLNCLILEYVDMLPGTIETLVAKSPLLEKLVLKRVLSPKFGTSELNIDAPKLKYFDVDDVEGTVKEVYLHAPLLTELICWMHLTTENAQQKISACNYTRFLGGLPNLEELTGAGHFIKYLSIGIKLCFNSLVLKHLRMIDLCSVRFDEVNQIWVCVQLITGSPNLHTLKLTFSFHGEDEPEVAALSFWDSEFALGFAFQRLKVIEMLHAPGAVNDKCLTKFLLARSPVLEKAQV